MDENDLNTLWSLIEENVMDTSDPTLKINYDAFITISSQMPPKARPFFTPSTFLKFKQDDCGCIGAETYFDYVYKKVELLQIRVALSQYDSFGTGYITEQDLENYIYDQISRISQIKTLDSGFYSFYVYTAVRKFFFFLDSQKRGKISIKNLVSSQIMREFNDVVTNSENEPVSADNWFSAQSTLKVYGTYLDLDIDRNGMLSKSEFMCFNNRSLTPLFIDRLFQECKTYDNEIDYKAYLDFMLAYKSKGTYESLSYYWKILDLGHEGRINNFTIHTFFKGIQNKMQALNMEPIKTTDVLNEIYDMVSPECSEYITLKDLRECGVGHTVVSILTDIAEFWTYDNRESLIHPDNQSQESN